MNLLSPYRVLDLTDERGQLAGQILADLGADVIRVEPRAGSAARRVGPFLAAGPESERSLSFAAYNRNKRSLVLDLEDERGREDLLRLVAGSDIVLDSGSPALLDEAGLDFARLRRANPLLVHVRVSAFGCDGPAAAWPASDLTLAALGGPMSVQGDRDRAPLRLSVPQAWRHAGAEAAVAALVGHARVRTTGEAVFVDVSAQSAMTWTMLNAMTAFTTQGFDFQRDGASLDIGPTKFHLVHACKDGYVVTLCGGRLLGAIRPWLLEAGTIDQAWLDREEWKSYDYRIFRGGAFKISFEELVETIRRFLRTKTRSELFLPGLELGVTIAPVMSLDDMLDFEQLRARDYYVPVTLPDGQSVRAPGPFARLSSARPASTGISSVGLTPPGPSTPNASGSIPSLARREAFRPAPRLGEHSEAILAELARAPRSRATRSEPADRRALPFEGLRVADFSWVGVGPISGKYLADHGANVIRIESSSRADNLRTAGPYQDNKPGWNRSQFFGEFNTSKRSLALDLKHARAREVVEPLVRWADVILESFTPGAAARVGFGYEMASRLNPSVIFVSTCLMGQTGPLAKLAGYGYHAAAIAGFYDLTGWPDRAPVGPWNAYTDTIAPRFLTATLLAALDHRRRTGGRDGEGLHIDVGQLEAALHLLAPELLARQAIERDFGRQGNRSADAAPQGVYPCAGEDEWLAIAIESDAQWQALRRALGDPVWARAGALDALSGRLAAHDAIDRGLAEWTRDRAPRDAMRILLEAGIPAGHVQRSRDLQSDPQLLHRRFHRVFEHPEMGHIPYSGHGFRISGYDNGPRSAAPLLGGESFEILSEELGFEPDRIADLMASGALS